ncbi:hypothetical protein OG437_48165 [Streptomyces phaeochromogenes]|nr:hypothetical protein OG437_48165 [Streptomyces phaeochromogenes]
MTSDAGFTHFAIGTAGTAGCGPQHVGSLFRPGSEPSTQFQRKGVADSTILARSRWADALIAVVVALSDDLSVSEFEERRDVGAQYLTCTQIAEGHGQFAGPRDFQGYLGTGGDRVDHLEVLVCEQLLSLLCGGDQVRQRADGAVRKQGVGSCV